MDRIAIFLEEEQARVATVALDLTAAITSNEVIERNCKAIAKAIREAADLQGWDIESWKEAYADA